MSPIYYLMLSAALFCIGLFGFIIRRNALILFMSIELMLNATNLSLVTYSNMWGTLDGQVASFFDALVWIDTDISSLTLILTIFRTRRSASVDDLNLLKH